MKRKAEHKSGAAATGRKSYVYYEHLRFLETLVKPTKDSMGEEEREDPDDPGEQEPEEVAPPTKKGKTANKKDKDSDEDIIMKALKAQLLQKSVDANNEDRLFMLSLVPELQKVPDCMKLEARTRLMGVFSQIRLEVQRMNSNQTPHQQQNFYNYHTGYGNYGGNFQGPSARQMPMGQHEPLMVQIPPKPRPKAVPVPLTAYQTPAAASTGNQYADLSPIDATSPTDTISSASSELDFGSY